MNQLFLFYDDMYQSCQLEQSHPVIQIGNDDDDTITIKSLSFSDGKLTLERDGERYVIHQGKQQAGALTQDEPMTLNVDGKTLRLLYRTAAEKKYTYYIGQLDEVKIGNVQGATIQKEGHFFANEEGSFLTLVKVGETWLLKPEEQSVMYLNGLRVREATACANGDHLFFPFMTITIVEDDLLMIRCTEAVETELPAVRPPVSKMQKAYPLYRRTPRLIYDLPEEKVTFSFPSQEIDNNQRALWLLILPPAMMLIVMTVVVLLIPRGIFILISIVMFTTTIMTSTIQYFREKKKRKEREEQRERVYSNYLKQKQEELQGLAEKQKMVMAYHFPSFEEMKAMAKTISARIWERSLDSEDFLQFRVGRAEVPSSYQVAVGSLDFANREIDHLLERSQEIINAYQHVKNVALPVDLSSGSIGLVGKDAIVQRQLQQIVGQLAFFHSYRDVRFIAIFDQSHYGSWEWMKWLPHFQLPHSFAKGFIYDEKTRDQLLSSIYEMLRERDIDETKANKTFAPHLVFIVQNRQLISDHLIMEYLEGEDRGIGLSTIFATDAKENLTDSIHTLISYINSQEGEILIHRHRAVHTPFAIDKHAEKGNESYARLLRSLDHQKGMSNSIPEMVSFLELNGAQEVADLEIERKWHRNQPSKSLAVPIGLKGKQDKVELNLHEKAHGPHGLVAGTTGSGKSELLQTYILSLAVHFHPHEVAFLLIDYKGGGMAQPFKQLPHLLGTITNISESKNFSTRALASINSEMKRRQRLLDAYDVTHIHDYGDLVKQGIAKEPMPHLFLISDEFAELKSEEPEFIKELVSAARIGRSLGVHLILATQKPGGVIDNQIWSNSRFKIALKVQDATDSKEILKNGDAATITQTGRGYLQVGNNEVYELFQSAWSGAPYLEESFQAEEEVSLVTDLGLVQLSGLSTKTVPDSKEQKTEIEAVVAEIAAVQQKLQLIKLPSPWLPPLGEWLPRPEVDSVAEGFLIGLKDEPEKQSQTPYRYQWITDGNIGVFGSSGYGKSTTLFTYLLSFAAHHRADELHYFIFDFGNGTLLPLRQLAHTADYFRFDDERKIAKFFTFIKREMEQRKQLFLEHEVSTITHYNQVTEEKLPVLFLVVDNFDLVKEELPEAEAQFIQLARDGQAIGLFVAISATRINGVRQPLMNTLKTKVLHYVMDSNEQYTLVGKTPYEVEPIPGRALLIKDQASLVQIFLPAKGKDDLDQLQQVKDEIKLINEASQGRSLPQPIPMLPSQLSIVEFFERYVDDVTEGQLPIGLEEESVTTMTVDLIGEQHCLIMGQAKKGKTNAMRVLLHGILEQSHTSIGLFDGVDRGLANDAKHKSVHYMESKEQIMEWLNQMEAELSRREAEYVASIERHHHEQRAYPKVYLLIDSFSRFQQKADTAIQDKVATLLKLYTHLGFTVLVAGNPNEFSKGFDSFTSEIKQIRQAILLAKKSDQNLFPLPFTRNEEEIQPGFGYLIRSGKETRMQIPKC
ncbi:type VII secretion protein EssC [Alkalihalobacillus oceani]|uniref:Type VII secretion protein EssC n=1 Tax=Halalkalibacter oceani TaxID=1653776 RepID=A0A9X2DUT5_9BACI|nr:type VII secretion protein EssC [Halalkalibacter oceani]MCM3715932.1 type VII secretion protein EssC [Halalkalibacter oceani]